MSAEDAEISWRRTFMRRLIDEHNSGMRDHATALWMLLMFEAFLRLNERAAPHG